MIKLLIAFFIASATLIYLQAIPGQVEVDFNGKVYQFSFFWTGLLLLSSFSGLITVLVIFNFILDLPKTIRNIFNQRQNTQSRNDLQKSFSRLMLGDFNKSEALALKRIHYSKTPGLHLLLAAFSSYRLGKMEMAVKYLNQSTYFLKDEDDLYAFESFKAAMRIDAGFLSEAQVILEELTEKLPKNAYLLDNLSKVYIKQKNYTKAYELLPRLRKAKVYSVEQYDQIESNITASKLESVMYSENLIQYTEFWNTLSRHQKNSLTVKLQYFLGLVYLDGFAGKENQFNRFIIANFHNQRIWEFLYEHPPLASKLNRAKIRSLIAKEQPNLANVVLARSYHDADEFNIALEIARDCVDSWQQIPIWKVLAEIYESIREHDKALECYRIINQKKISKLDKKPKRTLNQPEPKEKENKHLISLTWMDSSQSETERYIITSEKRS